MLPLLCIDVAAVVLTASVCVCVLLICVGMLPIVVYTCCTSCVDSKYVICLMYNITTTPQCIIGALFFFGF